MRPWKRWASDENGSSSLEFVTAGVLLLVPLVYLVLTLAQLQAGSFAVEGAARQAARVFAQGRTASAATAQARAAIRFALADHGLPTGAADVLVECAPRPSDCLRRHGTVAVTVRAAIALPLAPAALTVNAPLSVRLEATSVEQVSRFRRGG